MLLIHNRESGKMERTVELFQNRKSIKRAHQADIREVIEGLISEKFGFFASLQENTEEGEYQVYLHTDAYEDVGDKDTATLEKAGITDDPEECTEALKRIFNLEFKLC